ncbi:MAG: type II toxin-antitoxin system VapC family toxin [Chloroflexi bacterium]|nr:type II toxin-antitoxin system VapC family toxin [Chloroflexota bacterium]
MIWFVLDANAIARCYFQDIGTQNLLQILRYPDSEFIVPDLAQVEAVSATLSCGNAGLLSDDEADAVIGRIAMDFLSGKLVKVDVEEICIQESIRLLKTHKGAPGRNLGAMDALYLAVACRLSQIVSPAEAKVTLVTSDMALYNCALAEPAVEAFHFWTCQCPQCGIVLIPSKAKAHHCPGPDCDFECLPCSLANCRSAYTVSFD